jgi:methyl-accepting chemotaxis protein
VAEGATGQVGEATGQVGDQVAEVTEGLQDTAGQAVGQLSQTAEGLASATEEATEQVGQAAHRRGHADCLVQGAYWTTAARVANVAGDTATVELGGAEGVRE